MINPFVSIIIVTYNNAKIIKPCLQALDKQTYRNFEIVLVDNCSSDATIDVVREFSHVKLLTASSNLGFAGGNILGFQNAQGEYIVLLNPDTEASSQWLEVLVKSIDKRSNVGICASKLLVYDTRVIDSAGDGCITTGRGFKRGEGKESSLYNKQEYIFGACGGAMLIRRTVIDEIGFLDNDFFLIYEDTDFCFRTQLAGWRCLFVPEATVLHKVRSSIGDMSDLAVYYSIRNSRFVWIKNMPLRLVLKYWHHQLIQEIGSFIFFAIKHRKLSVYCKANIDFLKQIPSLLKKRREIMKIKKVSDQKIDRMLTPLFSKELLKSKIKKILD